MTPINQISNKNYLMADSFRFQLKDYPNVSYFGTTVNLPGINLGTLTQPTALLDIKRPGNKLQFEALNLHFQVGEDLANWLEIYNWMIKLGFPESFDQFDQAVEFTEANLTMLTNKSNPLMSVKFHNVFPTALGGLRYDTTIGPDAVFADATFAYTWYEFDLSL